MFKTRRATEARIRSNDIYARALFVEIVCPIRHWRQRDIATELNRLHVPRLRGSGKWTPSEVSRLLARVAYLEPSLGLKQNMGQWAYI